MRCSKKPIMLTVIAVIIYCLISVTPFAYADPAQKLSSYYYEFPTVVLDGDYSAVSLGQTTTEDLDGDGNQDLIVLGVDFPFNGKTDYAPQSGRIFLGDGDGGFVALSQVLFPVDTLLTISPRKTMFADFNGDGRKDMYIACHGWDAAPFPGEQNLLFLSKPGGGWENATINLPELSDFSHAAAVGDVNGDGSIDIFVGNGYGGQLGILSYLLINDGSGQFVLDRSNIPVGNNETLDFNTGHMFPGSILEDLNGDNLPELIITAEASAGFNRTRQNTILWNNAGSFSDSNKTDLPLPPVFAGSYNVQDVALMDANSDGLQDFIFIGTQGDPFYDGWFVQILINKGDNQFEDETSAWLDPGDSFGGTEGVATGTTWPMWVRIIDFNHDGLPDFSVEYNNTGYSRDMPFIWLNNGDGHFVTLEVQDIVPDGKEYLLGDLHLTRTRLGFSVLQPLYYPEGGGLIMHGLLATQPYRVTTDVNAFLDHFDQDQYAVNWEVTLPQAGSITVQNSELNMAITRPVDQCDSIRLDSIQKFSKPYFSVEANIRQDGFGQGELRIQNDENNFVSIGLNTDEASYLQFSSVDDNQPVVQNIESSTFHLGKYNTYRIVKNGKNYSAYINGIRKGSAVVNVGIGDENLSIVLVSNTCSTNGGDSNNSFDYVSLSVGAPTGTTSGDFNGDNKIDLKEAIHALQVSAGL